MMLKAGWRLVNYKNIADSLGNLSLLQKETRNTQGEYERFVQSLILSIHAKFWNNPMAL